MLESLLFDDSRNRASFYRLFRELMVYSSCLCSFSLSVSILFLSSFKVLIYLYTKLPCHLQHDCLRRLASFLLLDPDFLTWLRRSNFIYYRLLFWLQHFPSKYLLCALNTCVFAFSSCQLPTSNQQYFCD